MIRLEKPTLSLNRYELSPSKSTRFMVPTALSPLTLDWGAESCADNLDATALSAELIIPRTHQHLYPTLQDLVSLATVVTDGGQEFYGGGPIFRGRVETAEFEDEENSGDPANLVPAAGWQFLYGTARSSATSLPIQQEGRRMTVDVPVPPSDDTHTLWAVSPIMTAAALSTYQVDAYTRGTFDVDWGLFVTVEELDASGAVTSSWEMFRPRETTTDNQTDKWYFQHYGDLLWARAQSFRLVFAAPVKTVHGAGNRIAGLDMAQAIDVTGWDTKPFLPAWRRYKITAADATAPASRIRVGSEPWPEEFGGTRSFRISQAAQDRGSLLTFTSPRISRLLAPRDVDNQSALDCIQRVYASTGEVSTGASTAYDMVTPTQLPSFINRLTQNPVTGKAQLTPGRVYQLPAGSIQANKVKIDTTDLTNQARIGWRDAVAQEDASTDYTNTASVNAYGPMSRTFDTDLPEPIGPAADRAKALTELQGSPRHRLSGDAVVVLANMPGQNGMDALLDAVSGFTAVVEIPDPPAGIGNLHRVHGLKLTMGTEPGLILKLEPYDSTWAAPIMFSEVQAGRPAASLTLAQCDTVTYAQIRTASAEDR